MITEKVSLAEKTVENLTKYADFESLTGEMVNALIDKIEVFEPENNDGSLEQTIRIHYRFAGVIAPIGFNATRFYKHGDVTTTTGKRVARDREDRKMQGRIEAVQSEAERNPAIPFRGVK